RHPRASRRVVHVSVDDAEAARVNAIQPEHRHHRGERARRTTGHVLEYLEAAQRLGESAVALAAPVVEVAGDDERRGVGHFRADPLDQRPDLPLPTAFEQPEVYVDAVQGWQALAEGHLAMKQAAALEEVRGDVEVLLR